MARAGRCRTADEFDLKLFFCDLAPPGAARAQLDGYRLFLGRRLRRFEAMSREPAEDERIFPQLILGRAIARIQATLVWVEEGTNAVEATERAARGEDRG